MIQQRAPGPTAAEEAARRFVPTLDSTPPLHAQGFQRAPWFYRHQECLQKKLLPGTVGGKNGDLYASPWVLHAPTPPGTLPLPLEETRGGNKWVLTS